MGSRYLLREIINVGFCIGKPHFCRKLKMYLGRNPAVGSITIYFGRPSKLPQIFFIEMRTYSFFFCLILRDIANSKTPENTLRLLPIPFGMLVLPCTRHYRRFPPYPPPSLFPCPGQRNRRAPCTRDRRALQQLALNVHVKHSDLT